MATREHIINFPKVLTREGYFDRFLELSAETRTYKEAYYAVEEERAELGLPPKHRTYGAFRKAKTIFLSAKIVAHAENI